MGSFLTIDYLTYVGDFIIFGGIVTSIVALCYVFHIGNVLSFVKYEEYGNTIVPTRRCKTCGGHNTGPHPHRCICAHPVWRGIKCAECWHLPRPGHKLKVIVINPFLTPFKFMHCSIHIIF